MIIPVVALPTLSRDNESEFAERDTLMRQLGYISEVVLHGSVDCAAGAGDGDLTAYKELLRDCPCRVGPFDVLSSPGAEQETNSVVSWLDSGARRAIVHVDVSNPEALLDLADWSKQLPASRHRLIASFRLRDLKTAALAKGLTAALTAVMDGLRRIVGCVQLDFESGYAAAPQILSELDRLRGQEGSSDYVEIVFVRDTGGDDEPWSPHDVGKLHLEHSVDVQCPAGLEVPNENGGGLESNGMSTPKVDAASAFIACLRIDPSNDLIATVVCDTTGVALGLVYSNSASIRASLASGRGVYWSRSRRRLWRKGDTSGAWQELREISVDCDSDALKVTVWQHGKPSAFCHFNRRNCWEGGRGIGHLERTLVQRKDEAPEGSYTKRLFEDAALLRNKLVEEAQELAEAETKRHVAEEAADLTYFMMVRCAAAGVSFEDVEKELDMRSLKLKRRPGNAKAERIANGDAILGEGRTGKVASVI